ncbi:hypothetical protein HHK36_013949 [Tetracentron sinense]|uniref:non-specific serine/threonine protein kinase n=1 Tax=Tetracentron sinense TaxID=13715 RepID=A0A834Z7B3_TETSI|nr:hypothetical protein HHK36_013949 [Tetracentron sinense]
MKNGFAMLLLSSTTMFMLLVLSSFLNQASLSSVDPLTFSFPSFDSKSCDEGGELICSGSATAGDGYLNLTPGPQQTNVTMPLPINNVGQVLYKHPVFAWPAIISTIFTIRISKYPNSIASGDGMTFFMAKDNLPSPANSYGAFLGFFNRTTEGSITHQLAVELDTYMNEFDPDDNHVGIDTRSIKSLATMNLKSIGIDLKLGREVKVKIEYDGWRKKLHISAAYGRDPLVSVLNHSIIMSDTVPRSVYVGFTGSTGSVLETHQILNWVFSSIPLPESSLKGDLERSNKIKTILIIVFPIITGLLVLGTCTYPLVRKARRWKNESNNKSEDIESRSRSAANAPKIFTLKQLSKATSNFSKENLLGTGGFGSVYRGDISDPPSTIAVKKISATSNQGEREFLAEICTIGRLRHKNIVQLQGWCHEHEHLLLVYEFMPNGSLDRFISKGFLDWQTRYNILTGLASALLYLHEECGNTVVHRDVKPNNVMLDSEYNAHLGDFGLARLLQNETSVTTRLAGTPGYLAPECGYTGKATPECDVYSFGIVVLEVVCGRRVLGGVEEESLVDYVWDLHGKGELLQSVDGKLEGKYEEEQVKRALQIGIACSHPDSMLRPRIRKVVHMFLNPNEPLMDLPESRPNAIYVSIHSSASTSNGLGSSVASGQCSGTTLPDETTVQYGR